MAKKQPKTVINNIDSVNIEIDYDKLAEAIVRAQNNVKKKNKKSSKLRNAALSFFNGLVYAVVYLISGFSIYVIWSEIYPKQEASLGGCIFLSVILVIVGVYAFLCQQESYNDKETETLEYFNVNVSLIALIVALVALFKGIS